jgi:hypothetical protein
MRNLVRPLSPLLSLVVLAVAVGPASAAVSPFVGSWSATDLDGSAMTMTIGNGPQGTFRVVLIDHAGTICVNAEAASDLFQGSAGATVDGDVLTATWLTSRCGNVSFDFESGQFAMEYLPGSDTMFGMDVLWHRTGT